MQCQTLQQDNQECHSNRTQCLKHNDVRILLTTHPHWFSEYPQRKAKIQVFK